MIPLVILAIEDPRDKGFMEELYEAYNRLIYWEIKKIVTNDWDIEDVQQMALIRLIGKLPLLRTLGRDQLVNYIIVTSRNTALNFIRDKNRATEFSFDEAVDVLEDSGPSEDDRLIMAELMEDVSGAWRTLDARSRRLLELKYILDEPNEKIAHEIGVSTDSVRMLLTRARKKLKDAVRES